MMDQNTDWLIEFVHDCDDSYFVTKRGLDATPVVPYHRRLPVLTNNVHPCHEVVHMDYFIPGCPPSADAILTVLEDLVHGRPVDLPTSLNHYE